MSKRKSPIVNTFLRTTTMREYTFDDSRAAEHKAYEIELQNDFKFIVPIERVKTGAGSIYIVREMISSNCKLESTSSMQFTINALARSKGRKGGKGR